jgi:hypothetical protein
VGLVASGDRPTHERVGVVGQDVVKGKRAPRLRSASEKENIASEGEES